MMDLLGRTARQAGAYQAIAEMMTESIRDMNSTDEWTREWAQRRLVSLADQFEETVENYKKEVDIA
jgi:hypothetical protein